MQVLHSTPVAIASLGALLVLAACSAQPPSGDDIRPVRTMVIAPAPSTAVAELAGEVRPRVESKVGFQVAGRIVTRTVEVGQAVTSGQALATIDPADYRLAATAAQAQLTAAQAERDQQRADYRRFEELQQRGFISSADLERRKATLDAAEARHQQAAAQSNVSGNQAAYTTLRAPSAGVVTGVDAEVGQVVTAGQSVVRIAQTTEKEIAIAIPENRLDALRRMPEVRVSLWAAGNKPMRGLVREIAPMADPATRTFPARITLVDAPPTVALGMTATVVFDAPLPAPIIAAPLQALLKESDETYVWVLDATTMTVRRSRVTIATVSGNDVVLADGVKPGDTIVTAGVHLLKEGQKVKRIDDTIAARAPAPTPIPAASGAAEPARQIARE
jgi:RND family efflux transporter MFP subunit